MTAKRDDDDESDSDENDDNEDQEQTEDEEDVDDDDEDEEDDDEDEGDEDDEEGDDDNDAVMPDTATNNDSETLQNSSSTPVTSIERMTTVAAAAYAPVTLSRNWSVQTAHVPLYTGGKVTVCTAHDCILTPVFGNICLTDCQTSVRLCTVRNRNRQGGERGRRGREGHDDDENDDDDDMLDMDAITAYALAPNQTTLITCSQNSMMRQYSISTIVEATTAAAVSDSTTSSTPPTFESSISSSPKAALQVTLDKQWGKSGHTLPVTDLQFHVSGVFVASASVDGSVRIWDLRGAYVTHCFRRPSSSSESGSAVGGSGTLAVTAIAWFPEAQHLILAVARDNGSICLHNLRDSESGSDVAAATASTSGSADRPFAVLQDHVSAVTCMAWHVPSRLFVTAGRDEVLNVWRFAHANDAFAKEAKASRKKKKSSATIQSTTALYTRLHTLPTYEQVEGLVLLPPISVNLNESETFLIATAGAKGLVRLWTVQDSGDSSTKLKLLVEQSQGFGEARGGYMNLVDYVSTNAASHQLLVTDAEHNLTYLTLVADDATGNIASLINDRTIVGHNDEILDLKVIPHQSHDAESSQRQRRIVVATNSAQVRIFDLDTFACRVLDRHTATVLCVDVSPCGRYVATCGKDKQMRVWQADSSTSHACVAVAAGHTEAIGSTALSRKAGRYDVGGKAAKNGGGAFVVTVSMDRTLKRWNLPGATVLDEAASNGIELDLKTSCTVRAHEKDINIVSIAPNDSIVATGSQDKTVKLWKATDLSSMATLKGHKRGVWDVCFSPYDRIVATGSGDKTIKLWSLSDYSCVRTFQGHVSSVLRVRFLNGGLQLVSSGADGLVKLWTVRTNESEATMDNHKDKVWALDLALSGKELVSGGADSQIVVFVDTTKEVDDAKKAEEEEAILVDQKLANHLRRKEYGEALEISLERDKPHQTLKVLNAIVEADLQKGLNGLASLKKYAQTWKDDRLIRILGYCREWNTRARNSHVALLTVKAIVTTIPAHKLAALSGVPEILAGIIPYTERHFERLDRLHSSSYLLDFMLSSMGVMDAAATSKDSVTAPDFALWEPKLVLPPTKVDGRIDVGGRVVVGAAGVASGNKRVAASRAAVDADSDDDEVVTIGDSDDSDEELE